MFYILSKFHSHLCTEQQIYIYITALSKLRESAEIIICSSLTVYNQKMVHLVTCLLRDRQIVLIKRVYTEETIFMITAVERNKKNSVSARVLIPVNTCTLNNGRIGLSNLGKASIKNIHFCGFDHPPYSKNQHHFIYV